MEVIVRAFIYSGITCLVVAFIMYRFNRRYRAVEIAVNKSIYNNIGKETTGVIYRDNLWLYIKNNKLCIIDDSRKEVDKIKSELTRKYVIKSLRTVSTEEYDNILMDIKKANLDRFTRTIDIEQIVGIRVSGERWTELSSIGNTLGSQNKDTRQVSILINDGRIIRLPYSLYEHLIILLPDKILKA